MQLDIAKQEVAGWLTWLRTSGEMEIQEVMEDNNDRQVITCYTPLYWSKFTVVGSVYVD